MSRAESAGAMMSRETRQRLGLLIAVAYACSAAVCACRAAAIPAMTTAAPGAVHHCCQQTGGPVRSPAPAERDHHGRCAHCDAGGFATIAQKQADQLGHAVTLLTVVITAPPIPSADPIAPREAPDCYFLPAPTLLELHCALTT